MDGPVNLYDALLCDGFAEDDTPIPPPISGVGVREREAGRKTKVVTYYFSRVMESFGVCLLPFAFYLGRFPRSTLPALTCVRLHFAGV